MRDFESTLYRDAEGEPIDLQRKRFKFWLETVPEELRRLEYELWKNRRQYLLLRERNSLIAKKHEPSHVYDIPAYKEEEAQEDWKVFKESFPTGSERIERSQEIINGASALLPSWLENEQINKAEDPVRLVALIGSTAYGPRKHQARDADIDVAFLFDTDDSLDNFEVYPDNTNSEPFHLVGTGKTDESRGSHDIHWLLYPHYPLKNEYSDEELRGIIKNIVDSTQGRLDGLNAIIEQYKVAVNHFANPTKHEWPK